ncbi:outer membrane beta-barrel protein [Carboxylicivirga sp. N1Y90]|uniref:outer membrane beta-barrel protein n=1 Tax=Carboxylicivirga fragile TaxID=3417571 RepID=UPI003D340462|nr:PorT family protein [Marinilabiliaceae bacterium N1Y90]
MKKLSHVIVLAFLLAAFISPISAKDKNKPSLLVGFYGGMSFSQARSSEGHQVLEYLGSTPNFTNKSYDAMFSNLGHQFGFVMFYPAMGNLHVGLLPNYSSYSYGYHNEQEWLDNNGASLAVIHNHQQKLRYLEIPLVVRYYIGTNKLKPYVEGLFSYGFLLTADKSVDSDYTRNDGSTNTLTQQTKVNGDYKSNYITSKWDIGAGAGVSYDFDQLIVTLGATYQYNLNPISNAKNRYNNDLFTSSTYDVQDKLSLDALKINLSVIFPISKITKKGAVECYYFKEKKR